VTAIYVPQDQWRPPPASAVFGELSADGRDIILIAQASDFGLDQIQARLKMLTPAVTPLDAAGNPVAAGDWENCTDAASVPATWATLVQLGFSFNGIPGFSWEPQQRLNDWAIAETIRRTSPVPPLPGDLLPPWLDRQPRQYQLDGAAQIAAEGKFLLLDDPGTGKTLTVLLGLEARRRAGTGIFPLVIVVPSWEVGQSWADEIAAWEIGWPEPVMHKGPKRHARLAARDADVWITTYATLRADAADMKGSLVKLRPAAVIADEIHLAKNPEAKQSRALQRIARHAVTLAGASGTPVKRDTSDLHPMLEAMDPRSWPSGKRMKTRFCARIEEDYGEKIVGLNPAAEAEFFAIMDRNFRRVAKADVLSQLPPKVYSVRRPEIPDEWVQAYRDMEEDMLARLPDGSELPVMSTLTQMMRLSQLASSAAEVAVRMEWDEKLGMEVPKYDVTLKAPSWKAASLLEIAAERQHAPIVCFTASRQLAMIAGREYCEKAGLRTGYIVGVGDGITSRTRQRAIDDFQAGKLDMIVATAKAGGTGITLTRSGTVVFLQRDWELDHGVQPEDRCHRPGSEIHKSVEIMDIVARGTVEDRVRQRLREKAGMLAQVVRDPRIVADLLGGIR
jgi:SNF2 family DNA or RNA helicase